MKNRNPRLDIDLVPVGGIDRQIDCVKCPAACCREGMILPLTDAEADNLEAVGTELRKLDKSEAKEKKKKAPRRHGLYELQTACGNLAINAEGETSCSAYNSPGRPQICSQFRTGGIGCVYKKR